MFVKKFVVNAAGEEFTEGYTKTFTTSRNFFKEGTEVVCVQEHGEDGEADPCPVFILSEDFEKYQPVSLEDVFYLARSRKIKDFWAMMTVEHEGQPIMVEEVKNG